MVISAYEISKEKISDIFNKETPLILWESKSDITLNSTRIEIEKLEEVL